MRELLPARATVSAFPTINRLARAGQAAFCRAWPDALGVVRRGETWQREFYPYEFATKPNFGPPTWPSDPLDTLGLGSGAPQVAGQTKSPARRDGAWKVGGSSYESFSGFNLTWLMAFVGSEALRLTRVAEWAA